MQVLAKVQARFDGNTNKHLMILPSCQVQARFDEKIHLHFTLSLPQPTYILLYISLFLHVMILPSWKVSHVKVSWFMMRKYTCILLQKKFFFLPSTFDFVEHFRFMMEPVPLFAGTSWWMCYIRCRSRDATTNKLFCWSSLLIFVSCNWRLVLLPPVTSFATASDDMFLLNNSCRWHNFDGGRQCSFCWNRRSFLHPPATVFATTICWHDRLPS